LAHHSRRLLVLTGVLASVATEPAAAGTFHVYGLGMNGAGCPNGWQAQATAPDRFRHSSSCGRWDIRSARDGRALRRGNSAGIGMATAPGARFTGFSIRSSGTAHNGAFWSVAMCAKPAAHCQIHFKRTGAWNETGVQLGTLARRGAPYYGRYVWAGATCGESSCPDSTRRAVNVRHVQSHAVVEDYTPPGRPTVTGISTGWNSGERQLSYSATDVGSGVDSVTLTIDGSLHRTVTHACSRLPTGGYTRPIPCAGSATGGFSVNQSGQLADGRHSLAVGVRDAGRTWGAFTQDFWVDNNAPGHPIGLTVAGGDGWRRSNDFVVAWENPEQGNGSAIAEAYYKVGSPPSSSTDGTRVGGEGPAAIQAPRDGDWKVFVWLRDEAGNAKPTDASVAHLRLDSTAPSIAFANEQTAADVRVHTSDAHSGLARGQVEIRRQGAAEWRELATRREGTDLVTTIPDDQLDRGTYELRAFAIDAVGNTSVTTQRADGRPMIVDLPLRARTSLGAKLSRRATGARKHARRIRIGYRKRAWLRGTLRSGGIALPHARLAVHTRRVAGGGWRQLTEVVTGDKGRYKVKLPRGVSRVVRVRFSGSGTLQPATDSARLLVRGRTSLRLDPRRLRRGGTIRFHGRVGLFRAHVPAGGKLVQIQYLDGRRWRPAVKLGHTGRSGRFAIRYRFRRISRPTRIHFRILVPAEGGWPYATGASPVRTAFVRP